MPSPTPWSRFFLGSLLTAVVASIIVVAISRPSVSKQDAQFLFSVPEMDREEADGAETLAGLVAGGPQDESEHVGQRTPLGDGVGAEPDASGARASEAESPPLPLPIAPVESAAALTPRPPAGLEMARTDPQPLERPGAVAQAAHTVQEEAANSTAKKAVEKTDEKLPRAKPDPMKALSREFARRRAAARQKQKETATIVSPPAHEISKPILAMSQEHRQSCLVFVGDTMPNGTLPDLDGTKHEIRQSLAESLTVVVFWDSGNRYAVDQFQNLPRELVPLKELGVETIAIHVGPAPENYTALCQEFGESVLCLLDSDREYYLHVAQNRLPRTYLLDAQGQILWLDIEYSRTTRYELRNAIHFYLQQ